MRKIGLKLKDAFILEPDIFADNRGFLTVGFKKEYFPGHDWIQENILFSTKKATVRGMHLQKGSWSQAKLVSVNAGKILDVIVDLRKSSPTFMKMQTIKLSYDKAQWLFVPRGFAHGLITLEDNTKVTYKVDNFYNADAEIIINYKDPTLKINWPKFSKYVLSEKDLQGQSLQEVIDAI